MTSNTIEKEIEEAVPQLLHLARELTWNKISDNCKFILTEIKNSEANFRVQRNLRKKENDRKVPSTLSELIPTLKDLYHDLYDINLHIYRSTRTTTIIDIRYYQKSSIEEEHRQKILHNPPMLHCKIASPPWVYDKKEKFDVNWEHKQWLTAWKLFWARQKLKANSG